MLWHRRTKCVNPFSLSYFIQITLLNNNNNNNNKAICLKKHVTVHYLISIFLCSNPNSSFIYLYESLHSVMLAHNDDFMSTTLRCSSDLHNIIQAVSMPRAGAYVLHNICINQTTQCSSCHHSLKNTTTTAANTMRKITSPWHWTHSVRVTPTTFFRSYYMFHLTNNANEGGTKKATQTWQQK